MGVNKERDDWELISCLQNLKHSTEDDHISDDLPAVDLPAVDLDSVLESKAEEGDSYTGDVFLVMVQTLR